MQNQAMEERLRAGVALSVLAEGKQVGSGLYELKRFVENKDYCDPLHEWWIWSIGKNFLTGKIVAATDARFYDDPTWECLFLR
jgi:hypothetical protein